MPQVPMTQRLRSSIFCCYVPTARDIGIDPYAILRDADLDPRLLDDPEAWFPATAVAKVLEESARLSGRDDFGVLLGESQTLARLGPVALLVEHERSVREVVSAAIEFRPVVSDAIRLRLEERDETALIEFEIEPASTQLINLVIAAARNIIAEAVEGSWHPDSVHFRHGRPRRVDTYKRFFRCPVSFSDTFDGFASESAAMDRISPSSEPLLVVYARRLLYLAPEMHADMSFTNRVESSIYVLLRHGSADLAKVAATLGISRRSVQRALSSEKQSFEDVLNAVRRNLSTRFLAQSDQSISEIAYRTGFSGVSTFSRWFKREFALSPSDWRKMRLRQLRGPADQRLRHV